MSENFEKELEQFSQELLPNLSVLQTSLVKEAQEREKQCLDNSNNDVNRFVDCMLKTTKKINKEEKRFEFRMAFLQNNSYNCFKQAAQSGQSYDKCKQTTKDNLNRYLNEFLQNIKK